MRVAVVGGTGVIGRALAAELVVRGHDVSCLSRGRRPPVSGARDVRGDRWDLRWFTEHVRRLRPEAMVDLLCFGADDARSALAACPHDTHYLLCSSVSACGVGDERPIREEDPLRPRSPYGAAKVAAEQAALAAARPAPVTVVRPHIVYGPGGFLPRQVADDWHWQRRVRRGRPVLVVDRGRARQQMLHARDAATAVAGLVERPDRSGRTLTLAHPEPVRWRTYHQAVARTAGRRPRLVSARLTDLLAADPERFAECDELSGHDACFDVSRLQAVLPGWRPAVPLDTGIAELLDHLDRWPSPAPDDWEDPLLDRLREAGLLTDVDR
jgi:nucleoside-diphosphate-sugar epimerase